MTQKVILKSIDLTNFKGFAKLHKEFDANIETIKAENGQGKTTLRDSFFWTLGFNNIGNVIPSINNKEIPNLEIKSTVKVLINGIEYCLERTQREVWKTNKDTGVEEKMNNESTYLMDGIEYNFKTYKEKIAELLGVNFEKLLMLTEKEFFNSNTTKWGWTERRKELFALCNINELLKSLVEREEFCLIKDEINKGYSTSDIKKATNKEQKGYKEEKERNLIIISDKQNEIARYNAVDFNVLTKEKESLENKLTEYALQSAKQKANSLIAELQNKKLEKETKLRTLMLEDIKTRTELENKRNLISSELGKLKNRADNLKEEISASEQKIKFYNEEIDKINKSEWNGETICPTCKQSLPIETIELAKSNFESNKTSRIDNGRKKVKDLEDFVIEANKQIESMRIGYVNLQEQYEIYEKQINELTQNPDIYNLNKDIENINKNITNVLQDAEQDSTNNDVINELKTKINVINEQLSFKTLVENMSKRVEELKEQNRILSDKEMLCKTKNRQLDAYIQAQVKMVTDLVNSKFNNGVSFSLFNELYANSEHEISEECVCVLNGKTYDEMSYGEKFIADLEVTKTLQKEYGVNLPIFLDNAECVTKDYIAEQQLVQLIASRGNFINSIKIESLL